ncbi:hypothetical protein E1176_02295 [Fulvivirga sp. RKSG066]|uniref:hypothetical protein n=1 Tax=Fulvivirga aurantia TaxID=2529383 RepID=UPI0012BD4FB0|nr:hypothetical protein [Fulvivirga aurantia]MTI19844.1 hypothetical protein [Fulvivirga aurantia]
MEPKQRHGCVTAWLVLMIIANSLTAVSYLFISDTISQNLPEPIPQPMIITLAILSIVNLVLAIMLFQWKKWAFWAFAGTSLIALVINFSLGLGIGTSLFGLVGLAILYGILQIKKDGVTAWQNLE